MKYFIQAGGYGKRAEPLSTYLPKPLFPLNTKPLLGRMIEQLSAAGLREGFINTHYQADKIQDFLDSRPGLRVFLEEKLCGNVILKRAYPFLDDEPLLVLNGDIFLNIPLKEMRSKLDSTRSDCLLLVKKVKNTQYRTLRIRDNRFITRGPVLTRKVEEGVIFTGVFLIKKTLLLGINELNIFDYFARNRFRIFVHYLQDFWYDLGSPELYFKADYSVRKDETGGSANSISENVKISNDSKINNSIIWQNSVINSSRIENSIITGNITIQNLDCSNKIISFKENRLNMVDLIIS
jgi:mannose-1-phosphate guanylyltransferase